MAAANRIDGLPAPEVTLFSLRACAALFDARAASELDVRKRLLFEPVRGVRGVLAIKKQSHCNQFAHRDADALSQHSACNDATGRSPDLRDNGHEQHYELILHTAHCQGQTSIMPERRRCIYLGHRLLGDGVPSLS